MGFADVQYLSAFPKEGSRNPANPMRANSNSCKATNQDIFSMGNVAVKKTSRPPSNAKNTVTIETLADLHRPPLVLLF